MVGPEDQNITGENNGGLLLGGNRNSPAGAKLEQIDQHCQVSEQEFTEESACSHCWVSAFVRTTCHFPGTEIMFQT